jgi:hypothetical protein
MTSAMDQLFTGHLRCAVCGVSIEFDSNLLNFTGEFEGNVCGGCRQDFKHQHHETIEQSLARQRCYPGEVIRWRCGRPRS